MISFAALNKRDDSSSSITFTPHGKRTNPTKEAQESAILQLYHAAMKRQQEGNLDDAEQMYHDILSSPLISPISPSSDAMTNTLYRVKFLILKNIATIAKDKNDIPRAISAYLEASQYNNEDSTLFYQLALYSTSLGDLVLARKALEQVLHINPRYWPAIILLCKVLLAVGDYLACVDLAMTAVELNPQFKPAIGLIQHSLSCCPEFLNINPLLSKYLVKPRTSEADKLIEESKMLCIKHNALTNVSVLTETIVPPCKLNTVSIVSLGKFLITVYNHCKDISRQYNRPSFGVSVDLYTVLDGVANELLSDGSPVKKPSTTQAVTIKDCNNDVIEKRKRRLFSDSDYGCQPKRRSTRSRGANGARKEHQDYIKIVNKYLPSVYRILSVPELSDLIEVHYDTLTNDTSYMSTLVGGTVTVIDGVNQVRQFIQNERTNSGIISLLLEFLWSLSSRYYLKWTSHDSNINKLFIDCFVLAYKHVQFPPLFNKLSDYERTKAHKLFMISLCYVELTIDMMSPPLLNQTKRQSLVTNTDSISLPPLLSECMIYLQGMSVGNDNDERIASTLRVHWINIKLCLLKKQYEPATIRIDQCLQILKSGCEEESHDTMSCDQPIIINIPNCSNDNIISIDQIVEKKRCIEQMTSLTKVFVLYKEKDYEQVVDILIPVLKQESGSHSEFFLSLWDSDTPPCNNEQPSVQLLLESLINSNRIIESFKYCVKSVIEMIAYYVTYGASDSFISALTFYCHMLTRCFEADVMLLSKSHSKVIQNFITAMIKVLDITQDSVDTFTLPDELYISPWKLLHKVVSCDCLPGVIWEKNELESIIRECNNPTIVGVASKGPISDCEPMDEGHLINEELQDKMEYVNSDGAECKLADQTVAMDTTSGRDAMESSIIMDTVRKERNDSHGYDCCDTDNVIEMDTTEQSSLPLSTITHPTITDPTITHPTITHPTITDPTITQPSIITQPSTVTHASTIDTSSLTTITSSTIVPTSSSDINKDTSSINDPPSVINATLLPPSTQSSPTPQPIRQTTSPFHSVSSSPSMATSRSSPFKSHSASPVTDGKDQKEISLKLLQQAHSVLGSFGWCTKHNGNMLFYIVSILHQELRGLTTLPKDLREILLVELEQCYYCLYGYPYKKAKSRGLVEHNADQIPLTWDHAVVLLEYLHPVYLPAVDEAKSPHVTSELISLYKKIVECIPKEGVVIDKVTLLDFIDNSISTLPHPQEPNQHSSLIGKIYYLLADDCLRICDNQNAVKYYENSLSYRPMSFDTWAGLAIAMSQRITDKINMRVTDDKFVEKNTPSTLRCFDKALEMNPKDCYFVEKYGFFLYTICSFLSQVKKQPSVYRSKLTQDWANSAIKNMLVSADKQFQTALSLEGSKHSEPWIYHFMLGKIAIKLNKPIQNILHHFVKSTEILHSEGAVYPALVEVSSKGYAIQAVEVHYQFLTAILKLILSPSSPSPSSPPSPPLINDNPDTTTTILSQAITDIHYYPLGRITHESLWNWATEIVTMHSTKSHNAEQDIMEESVTVLPLVSSIEEQNTINGSYKDSTNNANTVTAAYNTGVIISATPTTVLTHSGLTTVCSLIPPHSDTEISNKSSSVAQLTDNSIILPLVPNTPNMVLERDTTANDPSLLPTSAGVGTSVPCTTASNECILPYDHTTTTAATSPIKQSDSFDEEELIIVDDGDGDSNNSQHSVHDISAIEQLARDVSATPTNQDPMSRFSTPNPDPLTEAVYGVAVCAVKFPYYFKPLYRLASTLNTMGYPNEAKKFLLGPIPKCFTDIQDKLLPIFALRSNIYQNMWQIQVCEINRPGNFSSHARSCLELLIDVLVNIKDLTSLLFIAQQLTKSKVDPSKQYMRIFERSFMHISALLGCAKILGAIYSIKSDVSQVSKTLLEAYSLRNMITKTNEPFREYQLKKIESYMMSLISVEWRNSNELQEMFADKELSQLSLDMCLKYCQFRTKLNI